MKIDRKQFNKWINALRSGKYKQGRGLLERNSKYCCLGVACKVLISRDKLIKRRDKSNEMTGGIPIDQPYAPKWLKELHGDFANKTSYGLVNLNDSVELSFDEIADLLEIVYVYDAESFREIHPRGLSIN